jgi:predicted RNA-binding protein with PIN domain
MVTARIWIMDGHNMIFAIPRLHKLQVSGRRDEARRGLEDSLRRFAVTRSEKVLVVYDGIDLPSNPGAIREPLFEAVYARRSDGVADDRIIHRARLCLEQGHLVTVVTDDVSTLARELPGGVRHLGVQAFWLKHIEKAVGQDDKRVEGDFSDMEREMEARAAIAEPEPRDRDPVPPTDSGGQRRTAGNEAMGERIRRKRERGRLRQERRLKRRPKPGRRR